MMDDSPSQDIPVEILELIFSICVSWLHPDCRYGTPPNALVGPAYTGLPCPFTQVCRKWHWVARTSPRLWSTIDLSNTSLAHYFITRTAGWAPLAPLDIVTTAPPMKISLSHIETACDSLSRAMNCNPNYPCRLSISSLDINLYPIVLHALISTLTGPTLHADFTLLTKLVLRVPPVSILSALPNHNVNIALSASTNLNPNHVTAGPFTSHHNASHNSDANANLNLNHLNEARQCSSARIPLLIASIPIPNVRHLELDGVPALWSSVQNLRHLSLRSILQSPFAPSLADLQGILARSHASLEFCRLESLELPTAAALDANMNSETTASLNGVSGQGVVVEGLETPIVLARLRTLSISAVAPVVSNVLHSMVVPPTAHVQLYMSLREVSLRSSTPDASSDVPTLRLSRHSALFLRPTTTAISITPQTPTSLKTSSDWDSGTPAFSLSSACTKAIAAYVLDSLSYPSSSSSGIYPLSALTSLTLGVGVLLDIPTASLHTFLQYGAANLEELRVGYQCDLGGLLSGLVGECGVGGGLACEGGEDAMDVDPGDLEPSCVASVEPLMLLPCPKLRLLSFNRPTDRWWNFGSLWLDALVETVVARERGGGGGKVMRVELRRCHEVDNASLEMSWGACAGGAAGKVGERFVLVE
ncbi:hypothetical protein DFP72DRAFT_887696 [Ephemerocybe angulata]|uniref:F-box domain-containing protein n=1 Tax=Ephemerocybe angulata TaxID=980116 RepID=A0A8H6M8A6_9AGAR|nr:hypothetical protein DFP72DRAFT_887696 [Tulosesus angulatus]